MRRAARPCRSARGRTCGRRRGARVNGPLDAMSYATATRWPNERRHEREPIGGVAVVAVLAVAAVRRDAEAEVRALRPTASVPAGVSASPHARCIDDGRRALAAARRGRATGEIRIAAERDVVEPVDARLHRDADAARVQRDVGARAQVAGVDRSGRRRAGTGKQRLARARRGRDRDRGCSSCRSRTRSEPWMHDLGLLARRRVQARRQLGAERGEVRTDRQVGRDVRRRRAEAAASPLARRGRCSLRSLRRRPPPPAPAPPPLAALPLPRSSPLPRSLPPRSLRSPLSVSMVLRPWQGTRRGRASIDCAPRPSGCARSARRRGCRRSRSSFARR